MEGERLEGRQRKRACDQPCLLHTVVEALTAVFVAAFLECRPTEVGSARAATSSGPPAARDNSGIFDVLDDLLVEARKSSTTPASPC